MGAYLTVPRTEKESSNEANNFIEVGASSMQGWRISQEDAHNCILDFEADTSFFSVYDGHGGSEVATYCAEKLPVFLKNLQTYNNGDIEQALIDAFLEFDKTLLGEEVIEELKRLAEKNPNRDSDIAEEEEEDLMELCEEGSLPLDQVLEKYKGCAATAAAKFPRIAKLKQDEAGASSSGISKPLSPFLRGRRSQSKSIDNTNFTISESSASLADTSRVSSHMSNSIDIGAGDPVVTSSSFNKNCSTATTNTKNSIGFTIEDQTPDSSSTNPPKTTDTEIIVISKSTVQNGDITSSSLSTRSTATSHNGEDEEGPASRIPKNENFVKNSTLISISNPLASDISSSTFVGVSTVNTKVMASQDLEESSSDDDADFHAEDNSSTEEGEEDCETFDDSEEVNEEFEDEETEDEDEGVIDDDDTAFCRNMIEEPGKDSGCTAVVALIKGRDLYVANAGDSRCVVCRNGKAVEMSFDHKPEDDEESKRIRLAGGKVTLDGRVNGGLNLSRAIGDHAYKMNTDLPPKMQMISALPDVRKLIISPGDEFMIIACDGIWNFMSSDEVVQFVKKRIENGYEKLSQICEELFDQCLAPNTMGDGTGCDNMTAVLVRFKPEIFNLVTKISIESESATASMLKMQTETAVSSNKKSGLTSTEETEISSIPKKRPASLNKNDSDSGRNESSAEEEINNKRIKTHDEANDDQVDNHPDEGEAAMSSLNVMTIPTANDRLSS